MTDFPTLADFLLTRIAEDKKVATDDRAKDECEARKFMVDKGTTPEVLRLLALPYVDHPDYREEWRP